jgi:hypothetical protein
MKRVFTILGLAFFWIVTPQEIFRYNKGCEKIILSENQILLHNVTNDDAAFAINLGLTESAVFSSQTSKKIAKGFNNGLFSGPKLLSLTVRTDNACDSSFVAGHIGYDVFRRSGQIYKLDFDTGNLCCLTSVEIDQQTKNYHEIDAVFRSDGIYIPIMLRWKTYELKFDTGYSGTIAMTAKDAARFVKEPCKKYQTDNGNFAVYPNKWITINGNYYNSSVTVFDRGTSKIGLGFLKGFNWIIDFRSRKLYLQKNGISLDAQNSFPPDYRVAVIGKQLKIALKSTTANAYQIGDLIAKVNNVAVTAENLCEMAALLSSRANWESHQLQVIADD